MKSLDTPNYKITGHIESPVDLPYNIYSLYKKKTIVLGELILIEYFNECDGEIYTDLVLKEERSYVRNEIGLVMYRVVTITWYLTDDTVGVIKMLPPKYYNPQEQMEEAAERRTNIMASAKLYVLSALVENEMLLGTLYETALGLAITNSFDLMSTVNNEISLYLQGKQDDLITAISLLTIIIKPYLTATIKTNLIAILTLND